MAVIRFVLNTSQLDDATYGLDGGSRFILDTNQLDDSNYILDGGDFLTTATGAATLGGLVGSASATVKVPAVLSASLGAISATAAATVQVPAVLSATLGAISATASATVKVSAVLSATLGSLNASISDVTVIDIAVLDAVLGGLSATLTAQATTPAPAPTTSGGRQYAAPRRKKIEPIVEPVVEIPVIQPKRRYAVCSTSLNGMQAQAVGTITFSILDDDAEVLLLV